MEELTLILSSVLGFCLMCYALFAYLRPYARLKAVKNAHRPLFVIAHPDDETMFFGPTVVQLCRAGAEVHLLCLSTGDYKSKGQTRKRELYEATKMLGIRPENITILSYTKLKDDPRVRWREELVADAILRTAVTHAVDVIFTFDRGGVSGHKNHTAAYNALALLSMEKRLPRSVRVFCLKSVNMLRKYSIVFDVPMSCVLSSTAYIASIKDYWIIQRAMMLHNSQYTWFRKLYMAFSRYVLINTYDQMEIA